MHHDQSLQPSAHDKEAHQVIFLATYAHTLNVSASSKAARVDRSQHYRWMEDLEYAERFDAARGEAIDRLEAAAFQRATEGVTDYVVSQGRIVKDDQDQPLTRQVFSDSLAALYLKGHKRERYGDNKAVEVTGKDGGAIEVKQDVDPTLIANALKILGDLGGLGSEDAGADPA
jgi:hypothetical protein